MNAVQPRSDAARLLRQLNVSPASVATAALWRGLRRPWLRWRQGLPMPGPALQARPSIRQRLPWAEALLDTATLPSAQAAALMMRAPCVLFGRCWNAPLSRLDAIDTRFTIEAARLQHLHPLAALHWRAQADPHLADRLRRQLPEPLSRFLRRALREATPVGAAADASTAALAAAGCYPMDHALRALSLLLVHASLHRGSGPAEYPAGEAASLAVGNSAVATADDAADDAASNVAVAALVARTIDSCLADPEYVGALSNNHHLTNVACLLVMMASLERPAHGVSHMRPDTRPAAVRRWLLRAIDLQFDEDGVHFEYCTGYHMCALELLALAALGLAGNEGGPAQPTAGAAAANAAGSESGPAARRWRRLQADCPPLAAALARAQDFARRVSRPDGSYPLIGDFDASRILRTHAAFHATPSPGPAQDRTFAAAHSDCLHDPRDPDAPAIEATRIEKVDGGGATTLVRALFGLPDTGIGIGIGIGIDSGIGIGIGIGKPDPDRMPASTVASGWSVATTLTPRDLALAASRLDAKRGDLRHAVCYRLTLPVDVDWDDIRLFRSAGLVVARGGPLVMTLRSGIPGQCGLGTHSHLDHLASDIWIAGGAPIADPGSWCYGASQPLRNRYRDVAAHFTPLWQLDWSRALAHPFFLDQPPPAAVLALVADGFRGVFRSGHGWVARVVVLRAGELVIVDASSHHRLEPWPIARQLPLADGYFGPLARHDPAGGAPASRRQH